MASQPIQFPFDITEPLPGTAPVIRCLNLLYVIMDTAGGLAARLYGRIIRQHATRAPSSATALSERRFCRVVRALWHVMELQTKLEADFAYRGEPARPTRPARPPTGPIEQPHPVEQPHPIEQTHPNVPAIRPYRKRKAPTFEQYFAGRSLGGIVENIRRRLGLAGPLGPWFDDMLPPVPSAPPAAPRATPAPTPEPPIIIPLTVLRATALPRPRPPDPPPTVPP